MIFSDAGGCLDKAKRENMQTVTCERAIKGGEGCSKDVW